MKPAAQETTGQPNSQILPQSPSQCDLILAYLQQGNTLTHLEALELFRCWALSQRVSDLKRRGHKIESKMIEIASGKRIARYALIQDEGAK